MPLTNGDIIVYDGAEWVNQKSVPDPFDMDPPTLHIDNVNHRVGIGTTSPAAELHVVARTAATIGEIIQAAASQTADLQQWQNSSAAVLASISAAGALSIFPANASTVGLFVRSASDSSGTLQQWQKSNGQIMSWVDFTGAFHVAYGVNGADPGLIASNDGSSMGVVDCMVFIGCPSNDRRGLVIQGVASQSTDLQRWQNNSSSILLSVSAAGHLTFADGTNLVAGTSTGTKIGTSNSQKLGFWNATPVVQQVLATGAGHSVDDVISFLQTIGLCKQS